MTNKANKAISTWLFIGAFLVAAIVITGGITRLTNSGLSMVTWEPISGIIPPLNVEDWQREFNNYKTSPEFQLKNRNFDLEDFKSIFWWEYIHRAFARIIGLVFIFPFLFFLFTKKLKNKSLMKHLIIIFLLGGFQGFLGWFMVSSGLVDKPHVNHYRLASHLMAALTLFGYIIWVALQLRFADTKTNADSNVQIRKLLRTSMIFIIIQIVYGAFMAGLKAGYMFPSFPKMGDSWFPVSLHYAFMEEGMLGLIENPMLVQFMHRWIPLFIIIIAGILLFKTEAKSKNINVQQRRIIRVLNFMVLIQIILGVYTILFSVPITLGVLHQFGAVILFAINLLALFYFRKKNIFDLEN